MGLRRFTTERPTFAQDNLLAQLERSGATVRATPVTDERGVLWNLLIFLSPLLLVGFYYWLLYVSDVSEIELWPSIFETPRVMFRL